MSNHNDISQIDLPTDTLQGSNNWRPRLLIYKNFLLLTSICHEETCHMILFALCCLYKYIIVLEQVQLLQHLLQTCSKLNMLFKHGPVNYIIVTIKHTSNSEQGVVRLDLRGMRVVCHTPVPSSVSVPDNVEHQHTSYLQRQEAISIHNQHPKNTRHECGKKLHRPMSCNFT